MAMSKSSFLCSGSETEIFIMKSVRDHPCEQLLIYKHDNLINLDIEINVLKVCVFCCFFSSNSFKGGAFFSPDSAQMLTFAQTNLHSRVLKIF